MVIGFRVMYFYIIIDLENWCISSGVFYTIYLVISSPFVELHDYYR